MGRTDRAGLAANMTHVLPPRTAAALTALRACDNMTVVFVVHEGLDDLYSLGQIWRNVPLDRTVRASYWSVEREQIPDDREQFTAWLYKEWARLDAWIDLQQR